MDHKSLSNRLKPFGQEHLLHFWAELAEHERLELAHQIQDLDLAQLQQLIESRDEEHIWAELAAAAESPPAITLEQAGLPEIQKRARQLGGEALAAGSVAMILTAGGQGSRLGFEHPKGMFPIGPLSNRTLYQIIMEKLLGRARQFAAPIPLYVMTSPPTHEASRQFLEEHDRFGYSKEDLRLFCQGVMPAVDRAGRILMESKGRLFLSPDGHGGMLAALVRSGALAEMRERGIEHVFYGQVDNPLIQACDPELLGHHLAAGSEMTTQVVRKHDPLQRVGNVVSVDGRLQIIEYSDLPEEFARQKTADGELKLWAGSIAVHVFRRDFLERMADEAEAIPFHRASKKVPYVDPSGEWIEPEEPNATKFERFIFDLLPSARNAIVCEVDPAEGFCAVKNAAPAVAETPDHVRAALAAQHRRWLRNAGVKVADDVVVEIAPSFAVDQEEVHERVEAGTEITKPTFLK